MTRRHRQLPWMRRVVVGSVVAERSGSMRVVREVSRFENGDLRCLTFTIQRCSWTTRCSTVVNYTDLRLRGFRLLRVAPRRLRSIMDGRIAEAIRSRDVSLTCCDVEGIA